MWYSENIGTFATARPFKYNGASYPATAFKNPAVLESATIYPLRVEKVDTRYYTQGAMTRTFEDGMWTESYGAIPKDTETLAKELVAKYFDQLDAHLSRTDKYIIRESESQQYFADWTVNSALRQWRHGLYTLFGARIKALQEAVSFDQLIEIDSTTLDIPEQPVAYTTKSQGTEKLK